MPLYPGASQGCDECRHRRKKCDLSKPECIRCSKAGIKCSGPKASRTFINRNATNLNKQSDKKALVHALQSRRPISVTADPGRLKSLEHASFREAPPATKPNPNADTILIDIPGRLTFLALIQDFKPAPQGGIFNADRISRDDPNYSATALCIRALLPLTSLRADPLNLPLFSLLTTYMGNLRHDTKLLELAHSSYTSALKKSRPHIQRVIENGQCGIQPRANLELILLLAIAFLAFEFVNGNNHSEEALLTHTRGVLSILQLHGPSNLSAPQIQQALSGFRGIYLSVALGIQIPTFIADPDWIHLPFLNVQKTKKELLHDIALQIPRLLYQTDRWLDGLENFASSVYNCQEESDSQANLGTASSLLRNYRVVIDQLDEWETNWKASEPGPLYWNSDIPMPTQLIDTDSVCIPLFPDDTYQIRFQNTQKAALALTGWAFRLEALIGMIKLQRGLTGAPVQSLEQNLAMAEETASLILQTAPYLTCCFEGVVASRAPLRTITKYFQHLKG